MRDWIDYYDSAHTIYVNARHRDVHFATLADDIARFVPSPDAVVLDYSCGEALSADRVAATCGKLILAEPATGVRDRLSARFVANSHIMVVSLGRLSELAEHSVDLVIMNSVAQYMTSEELDEAFARIRRLLKPGGQFVLGDILPPSTGALSEVWALMRFAATHGFLIAALIGVVRTALSDYRCLRSAIGLARYTEADMAAKLGRAGFAARRAARNIGHNPSRMTFVATIRN